MTGTEELARALVEERALHRLTEAYARGADRREPAAVASLFTEDGVLTVMMDGPGGEPTERHQGRAAIAAAIADLSRFDATTHFLGQRTFEVDGGRASGETYCLAYHVRHRAGRVINIVLAIRYLDECVLSDGRWLFSERTMIADWRDRADHPVRAQPQ